MNRNIKKQLSAIRKEMKQALTGFIGNPLTSQQIKHISNQTQDTLRSISSDAFIMDAELDPDNLNTLLVTVQGPSWLISLLRGCEEGKCV